jgi:hypothetical protein
VFKVEHPEVYASVLKVISWNQLAVEYAPERVVTPPAPAGSNGVSLSDRPSEGGRSSSAVRQDPSDPDVPF